MRRKRPLPWLPMGLVMVCLGLVWLAYERLHASADESEAQTPVAKVDGSVAELPATPTFTLPPPRTLLPMDTRRTRAWPETWPE